MSRSNPYTRRSGEPCADPSPCCARHGQGHRHGNSRSSPSDAGTDVARCGETRRCGGVDPWDALDSWRSHLARLPDEIGLSAPLEEAGRAFLDAWDTFETSRLAIEAKWRGNLTAAPKPSDDQNLAEQLIQLFCSDENAEAVLNQTHIESFTEFGKISIEFLLEGSQLDIKARVTATGSGHRVYVTPLMIGAVGPTQVRRWHSLKTDVVDLTLKEIADSVLVASERPLIWALALACAGRWLQAAIFARGALQLAELEQNQQATADEARLLRAEIRRLGAHAATDPDDEYKDAALRYRISMDYLASVGEVNAARRLREQAAQFLDAALSGVAIDDLPRRLQTFYIELDRSGDLIVDNESKARCFALMLMLCCYDRRQRSTDPAITSNLAERARKRHNDLVMVLMRLRASGQTEVLPHRARAMAVIGCVLFEVPDTATVRLPQRPAYVAPRAANVPLALRGWRAARSAEGLES